MAMQEQIAKNPPVKIGRMRASVKEEICGTAFALLPLVGFVLFSLVPIGIVFVTMFCSMDGFDLASLQWNGFANFKEVFTDARFGKSLGISAYVTVGQLISLFLVLSVSAVLSQKLKGSKGITALYFVPYICSSVAVAVMWQWMFNANYGIINTVLKMLGSENGVNWMNDPKAFTPMLIITIVWQAPGYGIVLYIAALTGVNPSLYEAAKIDGAGRWRQFTSITFPAISPTTFFLLMLGLINGMQTFDIAKIFAGDSWTGAAGPNDMGLTTVLYIYNKGVMFNNMPVASVMSFVLFIIIFVITVLNFKLGNKWVNYD